MERNVAIRELAASICRPFQGIFRVWKLGISLVILVKGAPSPSHGVQLVTSSRVLPVFQQQLSEEGKAQHRRLQRFLDLWDTGPCLLVVSELNAHEK